MGKITIFDVAKEAGVSKSTVSRVLNEKGNVNEKTRRKILKVMKKMNYHPNSSARSLVTKKTHTIGLVVPNITDTFFLQFIKGAEDVGIKNEYNMMLVSSNWQVRDEWRYLRLLEEDRVDGILLISGRNISDSYIEFLESEKTPIVIIDRVLEKNIIPTVNVDNVTGAYITTNYLLENGHRKIAFVMGPNNMQAALDRYEGYKNALYDYNIKLSNDLIYHGNFTKESGYQATQKIINDWDDVTAIFYSNDGMALGGLKVFKEKGIIVPDDISIVGCDNIRELSFIDLPLTTLSQPRYKMGYTGMELLIKIIENNNNIYPEKIVFNMEFINGQSVKNISAR